MSNTKPTCFGVYRSPQSDAENCCSDCKYDAECTNQRDNPKLIMRLSRQNGKSRQSLINCLRQCGFKFDESEIPHW